jgi:hypothetical protein
VKGYSSAVTIHQKLAILQALQSSAKKEHEGFLEGV